MNLTRNKVTFIKTTHNKKLHLHKSNGQTTIWHVIKEVNIWIISAEFLRLVKSPYEKFNLQKQTCFNRPHFIRLKILEY